MVVMAEIHTKTNSITLCLDQAVLGHKTTMVVTLQNHFSNSLSSLS